MGTDNVTAMFSQNLDENDNIELQNTDSDSQEISIKNLKDLKYDNGN